MLCAELCVVFGSSDRMKLELLDRRRVTSLPEDMVRRLAIGVDDVVLNCDADDTSKLDGAIGALVEVALAYVDLASADDELVADELLDLAGSLDSAACELMERL